MALIGRNGEGKTTLMRIINGELEPISGKTVSGHNVKIGYFAQNQEDILDKNNTVFETLDKIAVGDIRTKLRDILADFLFRGEDIDKKVSVLSGGERARLGMAKLMLQPYNMLTLDEPTNHMDIRSKDILKQALKAYNGTLVIVSHDRDFLDGLVNKMYEFRDGSVKEHLGSVKDFLDKRKLENLQELERRFSTSISTSENVDKNDSEGKKNFIGQKAVSREEKRLKNLLEKTEKEIERLEAEIKVIEIMLANPGKNNDILKSTRQYLEYKRELDAKISEWDIIVDKINEF